MQPSKYTGLRFAVCLSMIAAGICASGGARTGLDEAQGCAAFPAFGPNDSLNNVNLQVAPADFRVKVSTDGPEFHLRLEPNPNWKPSNLPQRAGRIRVFSCNHGTLLQTLEWEGLARPEMVLRFFKVADVNFDGFLDIAVLKEFGAKWGRQQWWVFSPSKARFVSNPFTEELEQIAGNGLVLDASRRQILSPQLTSLTGCGATQNAYHVDRDRLVSIHQEQVSVAAAGCTLTVRDRVNGEMQLTKVQHFPPYHQPAGPP